jgi:hypothetical protein
LVSLLLAVLPAEGLAFSVERDTCANCRCCVQPNTNPAPVRSAPAQVTQTVRVERAARTEPEPILRPVLSEVAVFRARAESAQLRVPSVALFERHCSFLI